jgi:hypothetical protein
VRPPSGWPLCLLTRGSWSARTTGRTCRVAAVVVTVEPVVPAPGRGRPVGPRRGHRSVRRAPAPGDAVPARVPTRGPARPAVCVAGRCSGHRPRREVHRGPPPGRPDARPRACGVRRRPSRRARSRTRTPGPSGAPASSSCWCTGRRCRDSESGPDRRRSRQHCAHPRPLVLLRGPRGSGPPAPHRACWCACGRGRTSSCSADDRAGDGLRGGALTARSRTGGSAPAGGWRRRGVRLRARGAVVVLDVRTGLQRAVGVDLRGHRSGRDRNGGVRGAAPAPARPAGARGGDALTRPPHATGGEHRTVVGVLRQSCAVHPTDDTAPALDARPVEERGAAGPSPRR